MGRGGLAGSEGEALGPLAVVQIQPQFGSLWGSQPGSPALPPLPASPLPPAPPLQSGSVAPQLSSQVPSLYQEGSHVQPEGAPLPLPPSPPAPLPPVP